MGPSEMGLAATCMDGPFRARSREEGFRFWSGCPDLSYGAMPPNLSISKMSFDLMNVPSVKTLYILFLFWWARKGFNLHFKVRSRAVYAVSLQAHEWRGT